MFVIGWLNNRYYWGGVGVELAFLAFLIFFTPLRAIFGTASFDPMYWWAVVTVTVIVLIAEEGRKWIMRRFFSKNRK